MSQTRKQRREAAAKAARTIQPVAVAGTLEDKLRIAYAQVEEAEAEATRAQHEVYGLRSDYMELEQIAHDRIDRISKRVFVVSALFLAAGVGIGSVLTGLPW